MMTWSNGYVELPNLEVYRLARVYSRLGWQVYKRFDYNARGSLLESKHWIDLLHERGYITAEELKEFKALSEQILVKINGLIKAQYKRN